MLGKFKTCHFSEKPSLLLLLIADGARSDSVSFRLLKGIEVGLLKNGINLPVFVASEIFRQESYCSLSFSTDFDTSFTAFDHMLTPLIRLPLPARAALFLTPL